MQAARLKLRSNRGYNINDNHGSRYDDTWNEWKDGYYADRTYNWFLENGHSTRYGNNFPTWTDYIEIQWNRRWLEPGQFTIYMPYNADAFKYALIAELEGRPETGIITKRQIETKAEGKFLTLSGYFAEGMLKWGQRVRKLNNITGSNYKLRIARFVAELLTSYWPGNRYYYDIMHDRDTSTDVLTEEGKLGTSANPEIFPILFHTEIGPMRASSIDFSGVADMEYDTKTKDACEWLYSVLPVGVSLRTKVYTRADYSIYSQQPLCDNALKYPSGSSGYQGDYYVCERNRLLNMQVANTPTFAASFEFLQSHERHAQVFSVENGNVSSISLTIDETGNRVVSRAHLDSDVGWWSSSVPITRGLMFQGDDGSYKYRAEVGRYNRSNTPGISLPNKTYDKWGRSITFGQWYGVSDIDANTTAEINQDNASIIRAEMRSQANNDIANHQTEETVEMEIVQTDAWQYLRDYDLGDDVGIELETTNETYYAKIVEIDEVHAKNICDVKVRTDTPRSTGWRSRGRW